MPRQTRIVIETIGDLIREGYQLFGTCGGCRTRKALDLIAMADEHGAECRPRAIAERMRCGCGHRGIELSVIPTPGAYGAATRH